MIRAFVRGPARSHALLARWVASRPGCALCLCLIVAVLSAGQANAHDIPAYLPHYDVDMQLDVPQHQVRVCQRVTWTNRHCRPAGELVFNAHSHYKIPDADVGFTAKMLEILRMDPGKGLDIEGHSFRVQKIICGNIELPYRFEMAKPDLGKKKPLPQESIDSLSTALVVALPAPVNQGETIQLEIVFTMRLPEKQGRWGHWKGVTFLVNWLPVLAVYDEQGWHPTPFIAWHQPFFNEAGIYSVRVTLPCDETIACTGAVLAVRDLGNGMQQVDIDPRVARDFAFLCSHRYQEFTGMACNVKVRVFAFPEHAYFAREMVRIACEAIPVYSKWFGPFPYPDFTIAESYFGWNGNECGGLVMIDERVFGMPHLGLPYVEYLVSHEICHQWWYNVVGTNGYCETWMDEGLATYFSHRLLNQKCGKNNLMLQWPSGLEWLPKIHRENYRYYGLYGTIGRGEACATVQDMEKFGHIVNLFSMCYDKGSKIVGMIEDRLGEAAFFDFMRIVYARYYFRILRVADFQHELEEYTGHSWEQFFHDWLYGAGLTDWAIDDVTLHRGNSSPAACRTACQAAPPGPHAPEPAYDVTVLLKQKGQICEQTVLGFCLDGSDDFQIRVPILPQVPLNEIDDPPARVEVLPDNRVRVQVHLPCKPTQIAVDPDQILVDANPRNNYWKKTIHFRFAPIYTFLEETDLTNDYDRLNFIVGPWVFSPLYDDPWFTRSSMFGFRAGLYRTQAFNGGAYVAYRTDYEDIVAGIDATWDHWPWPHTQVGFVAERRLESALAGNERANRGVIFGRYIFDYSDSLYLPPMHYLELYGTLQDDLLPYAREFVPGAERPEHQGRAGFHYHIDYTTPYWDPEGGFRFDLTADTGVTVPGVHEGTQGLHELSSEFAIIKGLPDGLGWFSDTRLAARIYGAVGGPSNFELFSLGGERLFRGFDLAQRQGNAVWVGSLEWRVPLVQDVVWDVADHTMGARNVYLAAFYDVGQAYLNGHGIGGEIAHDLGAGLRVDVAWFSFIERSVIRFDVAKCINAPTPFQFWFGIEHPF